MNSFLRAWIIIVFDLGSEPIEYGQKKEGAKSRKLRRRPEMKAEAYIVHLIVRAESELSFHKTSVWSSA